MLKINDSLYQKSRQLGKRKVRFNVLNWNIGGAKFLEEKNKKERTKTKRRLNQSLNALIFHKKGDRDRPDVITLQEIVQYRRPGGKLTELIDPIEGYHYYPFPLIDTKLLSSRAKWEKVMEKSDWVKGTYFAQGNAFLVKEGAPMFPVWDLSSLSQQNPLTPKPQYIEHVHLDSGLYFSDRNTEPRAAFVIHFIVDPADKKANNKPVDIFVVNVHLTTLMKEREGVPAIDSEASHVRLAQLKIIFDGIISRYNSWKIDGYPTRNKRRRPKAHEDFDRHSPVWILAGDFNFVPESDEYMFIRRSNFIDTVLPNRRKSDERDDGTKSSGVGKPATLTLDYIFAGPKFVSLDPMIESVGLGDNQVYHSERSSDHYPIFSHIEFTPLSAGR